MAQPARDKGADATSRMGTVAAGESCPKGTWFAGMPGKQEAEPNHTALPKHNCFQKELKRGEKNKGGLRRGWDMATYSKRKPRGSKEKESKAERKEQNPERGKLSI